MKPNVRTSNKKKWKNYISIKIVFYHHTLKALWFRVKWGIVFMTGTICMFLFSHVSNSTSASNPPLVKIL